MMESANFSEPAPCEERLLDKAESVFRQIYPYPAWYDDGRPSWRVFYPSDRDNGQISVSREAILTAWGAYRQWTASGRATAGTLAVSVTTIDDMGSRAVDDFECGPDMPLGHAYIDVWSFSKNDRKIRAMALLAASKAVFPLTPPLTDGDDQAIDK
jgi:hypothetical protein